MNAGTLADAIIFVVGAWWAIIGAFFIWRDGPISPEGVKFTCLHILGLLLARSTL